MHLVLRGGGEQVIPPVFAFFAPTGRKESESKVGPREPVRSTSLYTTSIGRSEIDSPAGVRKITKTGHHAPRVADVQIKMEK